jgi:hypothetical protein
MSESPQVSPKGTPDGEEKKVQTTEPPIASVKTPLDRVKASGNKELQRQSSTGSARRIRTISSMSSGSRGRSDSISSYSRRPSLSLGHADSLPMFLEKPTAEDVDLDQGNANVLIRVGLRVIECFN